MEERGDVLPVGEDALEELVVGEGHGTMIVYVQTIVQDCGGGFGNVRAVRTRVREPAECGGGARGVGSRGAGAGVRWRWGRAGASVRGRVAAHRIRNKVVC